MRGRRGGGLLSGANRDRTGVLLRATRRPTERVQSHWPALAESEDV